MSNLSAGAAGWYDSQGDTRMEEVLMDAFGAGDGGAADLVVQLQKVLEALGGRLVHLELEGLAMRHAAGFNPATASQFPDAGELRAVGEKMVAECKSKARLQQQREGLSSLSGGAPAGRAAAAAFEQVMLLPWVPVVTDQAGGVIDSKHSIDIDCESPPPILFPPHPSAPPPLSPPPPPPSPLPPPPPPPPLPIPPILVLLLRLLLLLLHVSAWAFTQQVSAAGTSDLGSSACSQ